MYCQNFIMDAPNDFQWEIIKVEEQLVSLEQKLTRAVSQMEVVHQKIEYIHIRYSRAQEKQDRTFCSSLSLSIATLQGVICAYQTYVEFCLIRVDDLYKKLQMLEQHLEHVMDHELSECEEEY